MARPPKTDRSQVRRRAVAIRVREEQRKRWENAAKKAGTDLSAWIRSTLDRAARMA